MKDWLKIIWGALRFFAILIWLLIKLLWYQLKKLINKIRGREENGKEGLKNHRSNS